MSEKDIVQDLPEIIITPEEIAALRAASPWWEWKLHTDEEMRRELIKERQEKMRKEEEKQAVESKAAKPGQNELKLIRKMKLTIGGVKKDELLERLKDSGNMVSEWALQIISKPVFTTLPQPLEIELGWIKAEDLGFSTDLKIDDLLARIKEVGYICPAEVGLHLKLVDKDAPYWIAMEPIGDSEDRPCILWQYSDRSLYAWTTFFCMIARSDTIVFVLRQ